jgi:uncharacterized protein (DUF1501 family)
MVISRRGFVRGGVAAFTIGFAAPSFLSKAAQGQGLQFRNLVVLYLSGGHDGLSFLVPYNDAQYYARRPTLAVPAGTVLQIGADSAGNPLGLHPRLPGLWSIFNQGRLPAGPIFRAPTSGRRPTPLRRKALAGSVAISIRSGLLSIH